MLRILSWNSNTGFEKMQELSSLGQAATNTLVSCTSLSGKRKRSFDAPNAPTVDQDIVKNLVTDGLKAFSQPPVQTTAPPQLQTSMLSEPSDANTSSLLSDPADGVKMEVDSDANSIEKVRSKEEAQLATMRQTISSQLSLEILLKHRELRFIDQELAKCQIALEQLRRCSEIPYPALQHPSVEVSAGKGGAVRKSSQKQSARSPAPWGVTDGPYTRHYAKWLLPDPQFDGDESEPSTPASASAASFYGRSTRGLHTDFAQMVGKTSRSQRALHQGLPAGYHEPKQKPTGPMILKRKSDGKMVKLVCPDCGRFDFGSAQGFINHCRIGHQRNFASHDAAAEGCGEAIELDESGLVKAEASETVPSTPVVAMPSVTATPQPIPSLSSSTMHPLVRSAHLIPKGSLGQPLVKTGCIPKSQRQTFKVRPESLPVQCSQTPNLYALVQSQGMHIDLQDAVNDAKRTDDLHEEFELEGETEADSPLPTPNPNSRHPHVAGKKQSWKSVDSNSASRKPSFSHARDQASLHSSVSKVNTTAEVSHFPHFMPLIPSPTNESTQAPSLIDDDEDMEPQSPLSSAELDDSDVHFDVRDDEHPEDGHELRGPEIPPTTAPCAQTTTPTPAPAPASYTRPVSAKDDRHATFITERPDIADQGDKKRRKIGP